MSWAPSPCWTRDPDAFWVSAHLATCLRRPAHLSLIRASPRTDSAPPAVKVPSPPLSVSLHHGSTTRGLPCPQPLTVPGTRKTSKSMAPCARPPPPSSPARSGARCRSSAPARGDTAGCVQGQLCGPEAHKEAQCSHRGRLWPPHRASLLLPAAAAKPGPSRGHQAPRTPALDSPPCGHTGGEDVGLLPSAGP